MMDQSIKRQKVTEESIVSDIASSIREISSTVASISGNYEALLKVNNAVALYMQNARKHKTSSVGKTKGIIEMDERMQAISFANSYFAVVDGLASGLENYLSEDVVLDWFGRTVRGRRNVTTFIEAHKVNSRHIFSQITPVTGISYKKKHLNRKKIHSYQKSLNKDMVTCGNEKLIVERFLEEPEVSPKRTIAKDINQNDIDPKVANEMVDDMSYDLCEGDLSNLFKLEIASTNIEEIEQSINRIKLEEEMAPTIKAIKRECGQGDGPVVVESSAIKYVEADGEIEFSRKFWKRDAWNTYITAASNVHTWRRPCKLQIAYTASVGQPALEPPPRRIKNIATRFEQPKTRLPSLEEINEISNRLIPNGGHFGGFLKEIDFFEDRKGFLQNLGTEMMSKGPDTPLFAPQYVENKLVLKKPYDKITDKNRNGKKKFVFNYQIHLIIYEGTNKCRMNLLHEFEKARI